MIRLNRWPINCGARRVLLTANFGWSVVFQKNMSRPFSQSLRHKRIGKGVHFMFEVVSRLKFSGEHDPAGRFLKKGAQSAFSRGCPHFGGLNSFFSIVWSILVILVCIYMFSAITKSIAIIFKIQNGCRVPENSKWRPKWHFLTKWEYGTVYYQLLWLKCLFWRFWVQRIHFCCFQNSKWPSHTRKSKMVAKMTYNLAKV